jgi:hypothetical protein
MNICVNCRLAAGLVLVSGLAHAQRQIPPPKWREYSFPADRFAITLPYEPTPHSDRVNVGVTVYTIRLTPEAAISIRVVRSKDECDSRLRKVVGDLQSEANPIKAISVAGHKAFEYEHRTGDLMTYGRSWCGDERVFVATARWPATEPRPDAVPRILNSFRLISSINKP